MFCKKYLIVGFILELLIVSCNTDQENKSKNYSDSTIDSVSKSVSISDDLLVLENQFKQDSFNVDLRAKLAANYYSAGELNKAAYHFLIIHKQYPQNLFILKNLGNIYYDSQEDDRAISFYEKALAIDSNNIDMRCDLATCYSRINKYNKAIKLLKMNIRMNYSHRQSHYNLSVMLKQTGKIHEAEEEMKIYNTLTSDI